MKKKVIYEDEKRVIEWQPRFVTIKSRGSTQTIPMNQLICVTPQTSMCTKLRAEGLDPAKYKTLMRIRKSEISVPAEVAEIVYREARKLEAAYKEECDRIANLPEYRERREIDALYAEADRIERSDSENNVILPMQLRSRAKQRLAAWREKYPEAAQAEKATSLMRRAAELRYKAVGALLYDADGLLNRAEQDRRHDKMIAKAEEMEAQARAITGGTK